MAQIFHEQKLVSAIPIAKSHDVYRLHHDLEVGMGFTQLRAEQTCTTF